MSGWDWLHGHMPGRHAGEPKPIRRCQHCDRDIEKCSEYWMDSDGLLVCMKYTGTLPASGNDFILHTPMPVI